MWIGGKKTKSVTKVFLWIGGGVGVLLVIAWAGFFVWLRVTDAHERAVVSAELAVAEEEDPTASARGDTAEETYALFLDALRTNPNEAASYFLPNARDAWQKHFATLTRVGLLDALIADLENAEGPTSADDTDAAYVVRDERGQQTASVHFRRANDAWYIELL